MTAVDTRVLEVRPPASPSVVDLLLGGLDLLDLDGDLPADPDWWGRAVCAQTDPEAFFPEKGGSTREAKRICSGCEVRAECLEYALAADERFGVWGACPSASVAAFAERRCDRVRYKTRHL